MKLVTILLLFSMIYSQNDAFQNKNEFKLIYEASSRGFYEVYIIQNDGAFKSNDRELKQKIDFEYKQAEKEEIIELINKINLNELPKLKAPTSKRQYDGAPHANLKIILNDKEYQSDTFDHGFPPKAIKPLIDKVLTLK